MWKIFSEVDGSKINPWTSCKALPGGPAPTLGSAVLSLGEIHRWDHPATSQLWVPGALSLGVCQGWTTWDNAHTLPLGCTGGKSRNTSKKNRLPSLDSGGTRIVGSTAKVPAVLLAPGLGDAGPVLPTAVGLQVKGSMFLYFCLPARAAALTHPSAVSSIALSPCLHAVWLQCCLGFHALLLNSKNSEGFLLRQQSAQSATRKPPSKSHPKQQKRIQSAQSRFSC